MRMTTKAAIAILALTTTAAPMVAQAQDRGSHRGDRYERDYRDRGNERNYGRHDRGHDRDWRPNRPPAPYYNRHDRDRYHAPVRWSRGNPDWWRGRSDFRDYRGNRSGYWYAPGYGYYSVEPRYRDYRWRSGAYLPSAYRSYYVRDPDFYGLRPAPRGYRYVHAGNDIVMIAIATGLITSVLSGIY